jgi:flagellar hook-length control protein FliK
MKSAAIFQTDLSANAAAVQSSIGKGMMQIMSGADFSSMMNQTGAKKGQAVSNAVETVQTDTKSVAQTAYDRQTASVQPGASVKEAEAPKDYLSEEEQASVKEAVDEIREAVKDIYDVTDEEIDAAMEAGQLMMADLLTPNGINTLVCELTQSDNPFEVLMTDSFEALSDAQQQIVTELTGQLELSTQQITGLYEEVQTVQTADRLTEAFVSTENTISPEITAMMEPVSEEEAAVLAEQIQTEVPEENAVEDSMQPIVTDNIQNEAVSDHVQSTVTTAVQPKEQEQLQTQDSSQTVSSESEIPAESVPAAEEAAEGEPAKEDLSGEAFAQTADEETSAQESITRDESGQTDSRDTVSQRFDNPTVTTNTVTTVNADGTQTIVQTETLHYSNIDVESLMRQITTEASVSITDEQSMMTMQLEPENLGKLTLQVVAKGSAVTAQIIAENEAVKQAIEANVSTLQENLAQNGLKVEAVDVTVEPHAFEQNLEQGAFNGQHSPQQEQQTPVRHGLYLNDLDELSGLMSDEELLAAQIMADNGNTMDISA